ncbi:chemotaxis protein CheW [Eubacteriaceae bacterium ES3]|nr:chemotaxis protein CheW [Eubacteriaceae bacterium ES3]
MDQIQSELDFEDEFDDELEEWDEQKFLTFPLGQEVYALSVDVVTEIIGVQEITEVPELPEYVRGIINLRGQIIPVIDLRLKFNKSPVEYDEKTCIIVMEEADIALGLIVDAVAEVVDIPDSLIVDYPETEDNNQFISGIGNVGNQVKLIVDSQKLIYDSFE